MSILELFEGLCAELDSLSNINTSNHSRTARGVTSPSENTLSQEQLHLLTEGLFFAAYRSFENYLENVFVLCILQEPTASSFVSNSYLRARDAEHARDLMKSGQFFLDWTSPDKVIKRAETYLENGRPFKDVISAHQSKLKNMKRLRNHIAHNSLETAKEYRKLVSELNNGILPLTIPTPGELLLQQESSGLSFRLEGFVADLRTVAEQLGYFGRDIT